MISQAHSNEQEQARFERLQSVVGGNLALFIMCAYHDLPFVPEAAAGSWAVYLRSIDNGENFRDGVTDPEEAMNKGLAEKDRWLRVWGIGNKKEPYTPEDYRRMDEIYEKMTERRRSQGGFDGQQEDVFRFCARTAHQRDKLMATGDKDDIDSAKKLDKMIQDNLAAENLRKKDENPKEAIRLDSVVERLNKIGLAPTMTYDDVMTAFATWCKQPKYGCTVDAADKAMLTIINCTRGNSDLPLIPELPEEASLMPFQREFDATAARREEPVYGYLNFSRGRPRKPGALRPEIKPEPKPEPKPDTEE